MKDNIIEQRAKDDKNIDDKPQRNKSSNSGIKPLADVVDKKTVPPIGVAG